MPSQLLGGNYNAVTAIEGKWEIVILEDLLPPSVSSEGIVLPHDSRDTATPPRPPGALGSHPSVAGPSSAIPRSRGEWPRHRTPR